MQYDFAVYDRDQQLAAVLEARAQKGTTAQWASEFRRSLISHLGLPRAEFFGIVTPDRLYLWQRKETSEEGDESSPPSYQLDARDFFAASEKEALRGPAFDIVVLTWLEKLLQETEESGGELRSSGFPRAIRDGRVEILDAA